MMTAHPVRPMTRNHICKIFSLFCLLLFLLSSSVYSHPGRTDSYGGHHDSATGEYHYHHGYEAHQHTDLDDDGIPDCPYDFDDKTGESSGSSSSSSQVSQEERTYPAAETSNTDSNLSGKSSEPASQARASSGDDSEDARHELLILGASFVVFFIIIPISADVIDRRHDRVFRLNGALSDLQKIHETHTNRERLKSFHRTDQKRLAIELFEQLSILTERAQKVRADFSLPSVPNIDEVSPLPKDCFIDEKGLPHTRGSIDRCKVYISPSGVYHTWRCHHAASGRPCNILNAMYGRPCRVCKPKQNLTWYTERIESEEQLNALCEVLEYAGNILSQQIPEPAKSENKSSIIQKPEEAQSLYIQHSSESEVIFSFTNEENRTVENLHIPSEKELHDAEERKKFRTSFLIQLCVIAVLCLLLCLRSCVE